jgi:hypothetical protein
MDIGSFPGVKWPGRGVDYPPPSSAEVEGRVKLYICSPLWDLVAYYRENFTFAFVLLFDCVIHSKLCIFYCQGSRSFWEYDRRAGARTLGE